MQNTFGNETGQSAALTKTATEAYVGTALKWRCACLFKIQQSAHLRVELRIGERICRDLVSKEVAHYLFGVRNWIQHWLCPSSTLGYFWIAEKISLH